MDYFKLVFILVLLLVQFHNAFAAPTSTIPVNSTVKTPISRSSNSTRGNNTAMAAPVVLGNITRNSTMATSVRSSNTTRSNNTAMDDPVALGNTTQNSTMATSIGFPNTTRGNNSTALTAPVVLESTNQNSTMPMPIAGSSNNRKRYNTTTVAVHVVVGSVTQNFTTPGVTSEFVINNTTMSSAKGFSRNRKSKCTKSATGKLSNVQNSTSTTFTTMVANVSQNATGLPRTENIGRNVTEYIASMWYYTRIVFTFLFGGRGKSSANHTSYGKFLPDNTTLGNLANSSLNKSFVFRVKMDQPESSNDSSAAKIDGIFNTSHQSTASTGKMFTIPSILNNIVKDTPGVIFSPYKKYHSRRRQLVTWVPTSVKKSNDTELAVKLDGSDVNMQALKTKPTATPSKFRKSLTTDKSIHTVKNTRFFYPIGISRVRSQYNAVDRNQRKEYGQFKCNNTNSSSYRLKLGNRGSLYGLFCVLGFVLTIVILVYICDFISLGTCCPAGRNRRKWTDTTSRKKRTMTGSKAAEDASCHVYEEDVALLGTKYPDVRVTAVPLLASSNTSSENTMVLPPAHNNNNNDEGTSLKVNIIDGRSGDA